MTHKEKVCDKKIDKLRDTSCNRYQIGKKYCVQIYKSTGNDKQANNRQPQK